MGDLTEVKFTKTVKIADVDDQQIRVGSVLKCIDENDDAEGVVVSIIDAEDKSSIPWNCCGPIAHGDLFISTSSYSHRVTNRYSHWKHIPRKEQTYEQRFKSWCCEKFEYDEYGLGKSPEEQFAIEAILSIFPEDPIDWEHGEIPYNITEVMNYLVEHLEHLTK